MKTTDPFRAADLLLAGLLAALAGCATPATTPAAVNTSDVATLAPTDDPPKPLRTVPPVYPFDMQRDALAGEVKLSAIVDVGGRVQDARVEDTTHPSFSQPALEAFQQWTFQPAVREGTPVAVRVAIPMRFVPANDD